MLMVVLEGERLEKLFAHLHFLMDLSISLPTSMGSTIETTLFYETGLKDCHYGEGCFPHAYTTFAALLTEKLRCHKLHIPAGRCWAWLFLMKIHKIQ